MEMEINDGMELSSPHIGPIGMSQLTEPALLPVTTTQGWKVLHNSLRPSQRLSPRSSSG